MESNSSKLVSDDAQEPGEGRLERARLFIIAVRNELKRVNWPSGREVYATTVMVIVTSVALGIYLQALELLFDYLLVWLFRRFGVS